ncbi:CapA family protein, partial [Acinetobacter seifertii]|nr:CapA family protein [Acinetobacter seifertii]
MTYSLFEIKLLAPLDHTNFDNAVWKFEVDGDVSTLLLIDYALEQFQQKNIEANKAYVVSEQKPKQLGEQNLGLEKNESYTFVELLQFLIFTHANDVKDALSNILFDSVEQAQLILSKRAENYKLTLKAPNQLKNLFLLAKNIYSYPAELNNLFFLKTLSFKNKVYQPITPLIAHPVLTSVLYISHQFRKIYITYLEDNQSIGFFSFLDDIHRLEHLVPYYHCFQEEHVKAKSCTSQTGIINILGDTYFGEMYTEKRKSRGQTDALQ